MTDAEQEKHKLECFQKWKLLEAEAQKKWRLHRAGSLSRVALDQWLGTLDRMDKRTIQRMYAASGGKKNG